MSGCCCFQCVRTQEVAILEDLGQFKNLLKPGLTITCWPIAQIAGTLSLRIQQLDVVCETKTKDNVFVQVAVAVQFLPKMELDEAFASKAEIASATLEQLKDVMNDYGYEILTTLVTDLAPDSKVKASMNEINASRRLKEAASHKAEADKVKQVKAAEAEAEARYLSGLGVARQRKAIVHGLQESVAEFSDEVPGATPKDVMDILLLSQYFDTLAVVGANSSSWSTILRQSRTCRIRFAIPLGMVATDLGARNRRGLWCYVSIHSKW
ncbi:hypothetical protein MHU86_21626 [Fragilaria crotonensis]|nr:hypothetical protein MHU86_21626 [Fragilaria crotonensis]